MTNLFGFGLAIATVLYSLGLLGQQLKMYFDPVALNMVVVGTFCAGITTFKFHEIANTFKLAFSRSAPRCGPAVVEQFVNLAKLTRSAPGRVAAILDDPNVDPFVKEGVELILGGFSVAEIERILGERLYSSRVIGESASSVPKSISKYPPAFGLMGTVIGLVSVMRGMGEGSSPEDTGLKMAVALVSTFYGLVLANIVLLPFSEALLNKVKAKVIYQKTVIEGILLIRERASPLYVQELLNSYITMGKRQDFVGIQSGGPPAARPAPPLEKGAA